MAREGLTPAFREHVVCPALIPDSPAAYRGSDACEPSEVFHSVPSEGPPHLGLSEATKSEKPQRRRQPVEYTQVLILAGWQGRPRALVIFERYPEAPAHEAESAAPHQDLGSDVVSLMSPKRLGSLSRFGNAFAANGSWMARLLDALLSGFESPG